MTFEAERKWKRVVMVVGVAAILLCVVKTSRMMLDRVPMFVWYWQNSPQFRHDFVHEVFFAKWWVWVLLGVGTVADVWLLTFCLRRWSR